MDGEVFNGKRLQAVQCAVYFSVPIKMQDSTWIHSISHSIRGKWFVIFKFRCIKFVPLKRYGFFKIFEISSVSIDWLQMSLKQCIFFWSCFDCHCHRVHDIIRIIWYKCTRFANKKRQPNSEYSFYSFNLSRNEVEDSRSEADEKSRKKKRNKVKARIFGETSCHHHQKNHIR